MTTRAPLSFFTLSLSLVVLLWVPGLRAEESAPTSPLPAAATPDPTTPDGAKVKQAVHQMQAHDLDGALITLNQAIGLNFQNQVPYFLRASIFASRNMWAAAEKDLLVAESITPDDVDIEMFLGDVFFMERKYEDARKRFASLTRDSNRGDLATYKVFVCDASDGHNDEAAKELILFDHTPSKPSCYYAHATRALIDKNADEGRRWLDSAAVLYGPAVIAPYAQCLRTLGYLPAPKAKP